MPRMPTGGGSAKNTTHLISFRGVNAAKASKEEEETQGINLIAIAASYLTRRHRTTTKCKCALRPEGGAPEIVILSPEIGNTS